jgi:hypothetical protein
LKQVVIKIDVDASVIRERFGTNIYECKLIISKTADKRETLHEFSTRRCEEQIGG